MTRPTYSDLGRSTLCEGERITAEMIRELLRGMRAIAAQDGQGGAE